MTCESNQDYLPFDLGTILVTPGVLEVFPNINTTPLSLLLRHASGDWGELCAEDVQENNIALREGYRLLSSYQVAPDVKIWVITEADRSVTTLLLPDEY